MSIVGLILVLVVLGVVVYVLNSVLPIDPRFKLIINAIVIVVVLLWVGGELGVLPRGSLRFR
jgi:hypothetical protein